MEAFLVYCTALGYIIPMLFGWAGYNKARRKHRVPLLWGIVCWLTSLIGYIVLCCSSSLEYDEELDFTTESDTLGYVMLILALSWTAFLLWINYGNGLKALGF
ncbi:MAG: hypothetical protein K2K82_04475 [Muribaculaceae bacterium]|nr:hypothetical protein [Muribaculaceae bacterium]